MPQTPKTSPALTELRRRIDAVDDRLLDQLGERARLMDEVRAAKASEGRLDPHLARPGREQAILRRLMARIKGPLPPDLVVRLWRDIMASLTRLQGPFAVAVLKTESDPSVMALARQHYGQSTPLLPAGSPAQVFARLEDGRAQLALLPAPEDVPQHDWWRNLDPSGLQVLARLPVDATEREPGALVVARQPFDGSGSDRGLLIVSASADASRASLSRAFASAEIPLSGVIAESERGERRSFLAVCETFVSPDDPRLAALAESGFATKVAGGYALPLGLAGDKPARRTTQAPKGASR